MSGNVAGNPDARELGAPLPRVVFFGSGAFGLPVLRALHAARAVTLVVSQPDRPAGRGGALAPTPVSAWAIEHAVPLLRPEDCNAPEAREAVRHAAFSAAGSGGHGACFVVIAYGQKMGQELLEGAFAINLHGSLLPRWRGAAPYQRALMEGDSTAGVTVIEVAERMDAGRMHAHAALEIGGETTAGELHDALGELGPGAVLPVLRAWMASGGELAGIPQDEQRATRARKLGRADAWVDLTQPADAVRARINGLSPWPGCGVSVDGHALKVLRARVAPASDSAAAPTSGVGSPGVLLPGGAVACGQGAVEFIEVQPPGGRAMSFAAWRAGRRVAPGARVESAPPGERAGA